MRGSKALMNVATFLGTCLRLQRMMQQDPVRYCINPAASDWLRGMRGRSAHVIRPAARLTGTAAVRDMSQVLIRRIPHRRPDSPLPASAAHHEGNRAHPGGPVWEPDRGEGRF